MKTVLIAMRGLVTAWLFIVMPAVVIAQDDSYAPSTASPVSFDREILAGVGIPEGGLPVPAEDILEGDMKVRRSVLHNGEELRVVVFESTPAKAAHREPFTFDEFVYILSGKLILTESDGTPLRVHGRGCPGCPQGLRRHLGDAGYLSRDRCLKVPAVI